MNNQFLQSFVQHVILSLLPGALGALLGIALARLFINTTSDSRTGKIFGAAYWVPWRGVLVALFLFLLPNAFIIKWLGLGSLSAGFNVFLSTFLLALTIHIYLQSLSEKIQTPELRSFSVFRTALTVAVGFGVIGNFFGAGGAGVLIQRGILTLNTQQMWLGYAVVFVLAILTDLLVALLGWIWIIKPSDAKRAS